MTTITLDVELDMNGPIEEALGDCSISGIGADSMSEYEITNTVVESATLTVRVEVDVERTEGKFAPRDEIVAEIVEGLMGMEGVENVVEVDASTLKAERRVAKEIADEIDANPAVAQVVENLAGRVDAQTVALVLRGYAGVVIAAALAGAGVSE